MSLDGAYPLLKSIYAEAVKLEHPTVPSAVTVAAAAAHDLSSSVTALVGFTALLLQMIPEGDEARPILLDMQSAAASASTNVSHLMRYAERNGARGSNKSLQKTLEDLRDT